MNAHTSPSQPHISKHLCNLNELSLVKQNVDAKGQEMTSYDDDACAIGTLFLLRRPLGIEIETY